ncbi:CBS domain-containing protein, partial [Oleiphilus sp. HI0067]
VEQLMHTGDRIPEVSPATPLTEGLFEISDKGFGLTAIVNDANEIQGLFTDGDLRRAFDDKLDLHNTEISKVMTKNCKTIQSKALAAEALQVMEEYKITGLLVSDEENKLVGVIHMHDLLKAGVV